MDVPADPRRLGWWIGAARPGDAQGTVLGGRFHEGAYDSNVVVFAT